MSGLEDDVWDARVEAIQARVSQALGEGCPLIYAAYPMDPEGFPIDNLDQVAVHGKCRFVQTRHPDFEGRDYESGIVENPTWMDVARLAVEMIRVTGNELHVFLDNVKEIGREGDVRRFKFGMGS